MKKIIGMFLCILILGTIIPYNAIATKMEKERYIINDNSPPDAPTITAPKEVKRGRFFNVKVVTTDPDGDDVYYKFEVDGHTAGWNGPFASGNVYKHWINFGVPPGAYILGVQAKDIHDAESEWSYVEINVKSKNRAINTPFQWFLQNHLNLFPLLRLLLQRSGLQ